MIPYMVGKLAPSSSHLTRKLVKYVACRGCYYAVSSQNGDKFVTERGQICQGPHPASPGPPQQSQHPPTPPPPRETEDSTLGKRPRNEPTDTNAGDTSGAGATLLTTILLARQVRLSFYIFLHVAYTRNLKFEGGLQIWHALAKR